ncbi:MAG: 4Fe-4S double cluster binding domain-containing protein [Methanomassiliicoccales archaeon]
MTLSEKNRSVRERIESLAISFGIAKVGYAPIDGLPLHGNVLLESAGMKHAISMVYEIPARAVIERSGVDRFYDSMIEGRSIMDKAADAVAKLLRERGYRALPVTSTFTMDNRTIMGQISHKAVAHQAGLGWIGRSMLLVTPEFGPRIRLITILTDAELDQGAGPMNNRCGTCRACIDGCPLKALKFSEFVDHPEDRSAVFDYMICHLQEKEWLERSPPKFCARCVTNCPWGKPSPKPS